MPTAILQVLLNLIDFDLSIAEAVEAPRLHFENGVANLEGGFEERACAALQDRAREVVFWPPGNLFFGGVHAVLRDAAGRLEAVGDPRRGGIAAII
jgi:gamma-glutamyltranspeptidase/glutathione hydrolase